MALSSETRRSPRYIGTGSETIFPFAFKLLKPTDLEVRVALSGQVETTLEESAYTVVLNESQDNNPGGTVTLKAPLAKDAALVIISDTPYLQPTTYTNRGGFYPEQLNTNLDRLTILTQQLKEHLDRTITVPSTSPTSPQELFYQLLNAAKEALESAQSAEEALAACEQIRQLIEQYSWDIPHIVDSLRDVENYPYDGLFAVAGYGNAGGNGQNISNRYVKAEGSTELRTLGERFADVVNVKDFGAVGDGVADDSCAIEKAIYTAQIRNCSVFFPSGTYLATKSINNFLCSKLIGSGKIKRGEEIYYIDCSANKINKIYVSPNGTGDGLSSEFPANILQVVKHLQAIGVLNGYWNICCSAGTYTSQPNFSNIVVVNEDGLVISGVDTVGDGENKTWGTVFTYPDESVKNSAIGATNTSCIVFKNLRVLGSSNEKNGEIGIYFYRGVVYGKVDNCRVEKTPNGYCIAAQMCGLISINNSIIQSDTNSSHQPNEVLGTGIYVYRSTCTTLFTRNRNKIIRCKYGARVVGSSYFHCDHNDFIDCHYAQIVDHGSYAGWNDCTHEGCVTVQLVIGNSDANVDDSSSMQIRGKRFFAFGSLSADDRLNSNTHLQGIFDPAGATNGAWGIGFNNWTTLRHALTINLSSNGEPITETSNVMPDGIVIQSKNSKAHLSFLTDRANGYNQSIRYYDISGVSPLICTYAYNNNYQITIGDSVGYTFSLSSFSPKSGVELNLGSESNKWANIYASTGVINTSDLRVKSSIALASDALLDAWGAVPFHTFTFRDAVEKKGADAARLHVGVVAQEVQQAFALKGLDATRYGLFCHDAWEDEYEIVEVVDQPEVLDGSGEVVSPAVTHTEQRLVTAAGDRFGIRYEEALCLEAAYQRRQAERLEERLAALEKRMTIVEAR